MYLPRGPKSEQLNTYLTSSSARGYIQEFWQLILFSSLYTVYIYFITTSSLIPQTVPPTSELSLSMSSLLLKPTLEQAKQDGNVSILKKVREEIFFSCMLVLGRHAGEPPPDVRRCVAGGGSAQGDPGHHRPHPVRRAQVHLKPGRRVVGSAAEGATVGKNKNILCSMTCGGKLQVEQSL